MKVVPMIFNTEMVKALLEGRKSVTRRPVKRAGIFNSVVCNRETGKRYTTNKDNPHQKWLEFPVNVGDLIWVRETFRLYSNTDECGCSDYCSCPPNGTPLYFATNDNGESKWKPSIHMPRSVSRLTLKVTDVRIETLNVLRKSKEQVKKEGFENWPQFKHVWESIYGQSHPNDYVWVIEFEVVHKNVDEVLNG
ncbi:ASCH domain-containing protein [Vibrio diazotrophicus]|uniref:ASCH domain-containing protein n=1 Tax=Vibrio diazotrophicus TaxID=685 RepID=A0ABX4W677_VIBDI|nr:ASCH domain-containing protein [Vibrio diazotrophicus]PNH99258.1 hypothetical protein C1O25_18060 [Vibrio diazotrophicus]